MQYGRYEIKSEIGWNGKGTHHIAHDPQNDRDVDILLLGPAFFRDPSFRMRFDREARQISELDHQALVPLIDFGEDLGRPYLVMPLLKGGTLAERIQQGPLPVHEIQPVLQRICGALAQGHEELIYHGDIQPLNIVFDEAGEAYLAGMGLVALAGRNRFTLLNLPPAYMPPERAQGEPPDHLGDIYQLGVLLAAMLTGRLPAPAGAAPSEPVSAPETWTGDMESVVAKAMAAEKTARFQSVAEFAAALDTVNDEPAPTDISSGEPNEIQLDSSIPQEEVPPPMAPLPPALSPSVKAEYEYVPPDMEDEETAGEKKGNRHLLIVAVGVAFLLISLCGTVIIGSGTDTLSNLFNEFAADEPAPGSTPLFGETTLEPGFSNAPFRREVDAGGEIDLFSSELPAGCNGHVSAAPTFHLQWAGESAAVDIGFTADSRGDAVLAVRDPAGSWFCNDDSDGLNPLVFLTDLQPGGYDIWVGSYTAGDSFSGVLTVEEPAVSLTNALALNPELAPLFDTDELSAGFSPDPFTTTLDAGGPVPVSRALAAENGRQCNGHVTSAPSFRFFWSGRVEELDLLFVSLSSDDDPTLAVLDPAGNWYCNDDDQTTDPLVRIENPADGAYYLWAGTFSAGDLAPGILFVSQEPLTIGDVVPGSVISTTGELDPFALPNYGSEGLTAGFAPQPFITDVISGGAVDVAFLELGQNCTGFISSNPDFRLEWAGITDRLAFAFTADSEGDDGTLVILDPAGIYHCNDDFDNLDPQVEIEQPPAGEYSVWIGSYNEGVFFPGTLAIEE